MLQKVIAASLVLVLGASIASAEQIRAVILKVDGDKVTFAPLEGRGKDAKRGEEKMLTAAKDVKVVEAKRNPETKKLEVGDVIEGGLKHKRFGKIGKNGIRGMIITDSDNKTITEIRVMARSRQPK